MQPPRPLEVEKVLLAIEELRRWEARRDQLDVARRSAAPPSAEELARVQQQIAYYDGLLHDMKRRAHPDTVPRFMGRWAK